MATLKSIKNKYLAASDGDVLGVTTNTENVAALSFKLATADSLTKFNLVDGFTDDYNDATGVDVATSTNEVRDSANYYTGVDASNYFGNSDLGTVTFGSSSVSQSGQTSTIDSVLSTGTASGGPGSSSYGGTVPNSSACYELTVPNHVSSYDGDMVCAQFANLTIDASVTLTTKRPCRGLFIYVDGDCTINGALSMTARGGYSNPTTSGGSDSSTVSATGIRLPMKTSGGSSTLAAADFAGAGTGVKTAVANQGAISGNGEIFTVSLAGGAGGGTNGAVGADGTTGAAIIGTGGGAAGNQTGPGSWGGYGRAGSVFAGGPAGGGNWGNSGGGAATDYGGPGGNGVHPSNNDMGGGSGNPGGTSNPAAPRGAESGVGGVIWLVVTGNLTIGGSGSIQANGQRGGQHYGGSSGGGAIHALYAGTLSNSGAVQCLGGVGGGGTNGPDGGGGGTNIAAVSGLAYNNMTLQSNAFTAQAAPTTARIILDEYTSTGSATLNADIKAYASIDNGTTYTQITLANQGTIETNHRLLSGSADISGQPSGTSVKYKIETLNQSASKVTRVYGTSMAWA